MTLSGVATAKNIDWVSIVETLRGRSAAQIVKIAQDAAKAVVLNGEKIVQEKHLRDSCDDLYFHIPDTLH